MSLENVEAGDLLVLDRNYQAVLLVRVDRTTKTQIIVGSARYRKRNGFKVGSRADVWGRTYVRLPREGEVEKIIEETRRSRCKTIIKRFVDSQHFDVVPLNILNPIVQEIEEYHAAQEANSG